MDKNAIKKFAVWARTELIARVSLKGVEYGITEDNIEDANADSVGGKVLTADEKKQRQALIAEINDKGYKQVMEGGCLHLVQPLLCSTIHGSQRLSSFSCACIHGRGKQL